MEFNKWNDHLRREAAKSKPKIRCPACNPEIPQDSAVKATFTSFEKHYSDSPTC
jgi:ribosomal protein S26